MIGYIKFFVTNLHILPKRRKLSYLLMSNYPKITVPANYFKEMY